MNTLLKSILVLVFFGFSLVSEAKLLQIIHTNDLHSYFKGYRNGHGGYARLRTKIEQLRAESERRGIEVLQLDAGDFGEGTSFFVSDHGATSLRALGMLGVDIAVIGNHDHMMGGRVLSDQIRRSKVKTSFLSANLAHTPEMQLGAFIRPYADIEKAGIKIRVIGLSTAEAHFQYQLKPGIIIPSVPVGITQSKEARKQGRELIIALTHIGQKKDVELARGSTEIDLIVGGHSHDFLEEVRWEKNKNKRPVPIVQAGSHGLVVGSLLIDFKEDGKLNVVSYKLHRILGPLEEDQEMANLVMEAVEDRNRYFGGRWEDIIGESLVPLSGYVEGHASRSESCWGRHMAKMTRDASKASLAVHLASFEGEQIPAGPISFGDMIDNFPHFRNYGDPGWEISTINLKGPLFKSLVAAIINLKDKMGISMNGVTYKSIRVPRFVPYLGGKVVPYRMKVDGKSIKNKVSYSIAFPSEVAFALKEFLPTASAKLFPSLKSTGKFYWEVMEEYFQKNSPISCR